MIRTLAAAAVFHGIPRFFVEHNAEEENKGTLGLDNRREKVRTKDWSFLSDCFTENTRAHLHTVEPSEQVVEDDHVAVDGE